MVGRQRTRTTFGRVFTFTTRCSCRVSLTSAATAVADDEALRRRVYNGLISSLDSFLTDDGIDDDDDDEGMMSLRS